jgi:uncharacterized protein
MGIPQSVRASSAVTQSMRFRGELPLSLLPRLGAALAASEGELQVDLEAGKARGLPQLSGTVSGQLSLQCRRCDAIYQWPLDLQVGLYLVSSEDEEQALPQDADPCEVQDDQLLLREVVEDEVLLALPMLPRCQMCETIVQSAPPPARVEAPVEVRENPFASLKQRFRKDQ